MVPEANNKSCLKETKKKSQMFYKKCIGVLNELAESSDVAPKSTNLVDMKKEELKDLQAKLTMQEKEQEVAHHP